MAQNLSNYTIPGLVTVPLSQPDGITAKEAKAEGQGSKGARRQKLESLADGLKICRDFVGVAVNLNVKK